MLDYRVAIEAGAVLLAAERANVEQLSRLEELTARMAAADDFEEYRRFDIRFHIGLAEAAGSPRLVTAMTEVQGQMSDLISLIAHPTEVLTRSNDQHRRLVMLLAQRRRRRRRAAAARAHRGDRAHHRRPPPGARQPA